MESGQPKKTETLEVRAVFEPSRIAPLCVAQAYERVVPVARRRITAGQTDNRGAGRDEAEQQQHRQGAAR